MMSEGKTEEKGDYLPGLYFSSSPVPINVVIMFNCLSEAQHL